MIQLDTVLGKSSINGKLSKLYMLQFSDASAYIIINQMGCIAEPQQQRHRPPPHYRQQPINRSPPPPPQIQTHNLPPPTPSHAPPPMSRDRRRVNAGKLTEPAFNESIFRRKYGNDARASPPFTIQIKLPTNQKMTHYKYVEQPLWIFPPGIFRMPWEEVRNACFQEKMTWIRMHVEGLRVPWEQGCEWLQVDRHNVLMSTQDDLATANLRKEVKIRFDQEEVDDAGGLLRQWLHLCIKELCNTQMTGLMGLCNTEETAYKFLADPSLTEDEMYYKQMLARMMGLVIGKGLFDRIPLNVYLTRSIWRQVLGKPPIRGDFYAYDKDIYNSCMDILSTPNPDDLGLNFTYLISHPKLPSQQVQLKPNGKEIFVTQQNKQQYVQLLMNYLMVESCRPFIQVIRSQINQIFPIKLLEIFEPHQLESMINGPPHINVKQWRLSTLYRGYKDSEKQVQWFWQYVEGLTQQKLGNLLHYVTGTRRVPVLGFFYLESNRNTITRFMIEKVTYTPSNPYPKSHTCFNRLELPTYATQTELNQRMHELLANEINSYGMS